MEHRDHFQKALQGRKVQSISWPNEDFIEVGGSVREIAYIGSGWFEVRYTNQRVMLVNSNSLSDVRMVTEDENIGGPTDGPTYM